MMVDLKAQLVGKPNYSGEVADRFDRLLLLLLQFLKLRIDGQGVVYPYLKRIENNSAPHESALQDDLWLFLTRTEYPEAEKTDVSAGRVDIYIQQRGFRFVIEVKRLQEEWTEKALQPLLRQTTAYQQTDVRLGILSVLDLSDRPAGLPHMDECFFLRPRVASPTDTRHAVVMRVPGNRRTPSDHWTPR
jgi:hypothetical protein